MIEILFILFLFSSQYKNAHSVFLSPDVTLLLAVILIPYTAILYRKTTKGKFFNQSTVTFLLFSTWIILSTIWAPSSFYTTSKALCFLVYTLPAFFIGHLITGRDPKRLERFLWIIILFSFFVQGEAYRLSFLTHGKMGDVLGNNYLVAGQTIGIGFLLLMVMSFFQLRQGRHPLYWILMFLCGTFCTIQFHLGGRGPVLAAFLSLVLFYGNGVVGPDSPLYRRHLFHFLAISIVTYILFSWLSQTELCQFWIRFLPVFDPTHADEPLSTRFDYYRSALLAFTEHPFIGLGLGGWPIYRNLGDLPWQHPHNIALEVLAETGIIGGILGLAFGISVLKTISFAPKHQSSLSISCVILLFFATLNALKSGDLNDNIILFTMAGIITAWARQPGDRS
ncbi:MAG: O-antigen ligase family protein [Alphaproteobacteria bacterium]|nr:O-antigen ligase family protein [Alphaproteobacteria bacterium]